MTKTWSNARRQLGVEMSRMRKTVSNLLITACIAGCSLVVLPACSGGNSNDNPSEDAGTDTPVDEEAPEFQDVSASIKGEFSSQVSLDEDATRVLPVAANAEFTVFARDNETDAEDLDVDIVDEDGEPLTEEESNFQNGLWRITVELGPGTTAAVEATDEAGNSARSNSTLTIPTRRNALVEGWQRRTYTNDDQSIDERWDLTMNDDGTWEEVRPDTTRGGTFSVDGDTLQMTRTYRSDGDSDDQTAERRVAGEFYVDGTYFHLRPWTRENASDANDDIAGTWSREYKIFTRRDGALELERDVSETLEFQQTSDGDNTWSLTRSGTEYGANSQSSIDETEGGTWEVVENESYGGNFGDYLVRTTTTENGNSVDQPTTVTELFQMPLDKLLISPHLDVE